MLLYVCLILEVSILVSFFIYFVRTLISSFPWMRLIQTQKPTTLCKYTLKIYINFIYEGCYTIYINFFSAIRPKRLSRALNPTYRICFLKIGVGVHCSTGTLRENTIKYEDLNFKKFSQFQKNYWSSFVTFLVLKSIKISLIKGLDFRNMFNFK